MREKVKRKSIAIYPTYESKEAEERALRSKAYELAMIGQRYGHTAKGGEDTNSTA